MNIRTVEFEVLFLNNTSGIIIIIAPLVFKQWTICAMGLPGFLNKVFAKN